MDITRFDKVLLPIQTVDLIHPYSDACDVACKIRCMKLGEVIATKLKCLLQRQHAPDLFDYAYSIKLLGGELNKEEVVKTFVQKTIFGRNPHVLKNILHKTPFDYFKEYWDKTVVCAKQFIFGVDEAINIFISDLEILFGIYPDNGFAQFAYFGPELRMPIMKAGREQTLLKIRYKGADRIVEPYSLKYLRRKDGVEREYFYVCNRSGGDNQPGVRCFVAEKIESIENTEEKFVPQFPIELSKAGETPENPYLFDPNRPTPAPRPRKAFGMMRSSRHSSFELKYIYQCSYCGRKFIKTKHDSNIREHKDKNGYRCGGRHGYYVDTKY
jgi:DNA-directed RNA polymerase subunit RPC12/RpoP